MAVSKKFRWTDANGETIEVDFGADGGNVTINEKPLTDVLEEMGDAIESIRNYSTTPQRIGTWINGTPVWMVGFSGAPTALDLLDQIYNAGVNMKVTDSGQVLILDQIAYGTDIDAPDGMVDYIPLEVDTSANFKINSNTKNVYGYIIYITPESNISSTS